MRTAAVLIAVLIGPALSALAEDQPTTAPADRPVVNKRLADMPPNVWLKFHEQGEGDVRFQRQAHGGSCMDTKRDRLILFGSNTHGKNWYNTPFFFDPVAERWTQLYPPDARATYKVTDAGLPVAGADGDHPWATHTFGTVEYDPSRDEMVVACYPGHMIPGRFSNSMTDLWPKVKKFPTWVLDFKTDKWTPLPCDAVHFFPQSACFDTDRNVVLGYRPDGVWELGGQPRTWTRKTKSVNLPGWHSNSVYDAKVKAMVTFGRQTNANDIDAYFVKTGEIKLMPTPGVRPPKDQHNPMAFDPSIGMTVVVIDRTPEAEQGAKPRTVSETWCYDLAADAWTQAPTATLPFGCGMDFNMEYDPAQKCLLLVTGDPAPPTVWALRIDLSKVEKAKE
ncbi:MAG: hypothetical protein BIFFINMI_03537 [Phycisphaerae bacterium]|nr:hypothetical protein [Phycisphaerae bacterium]